MTGSVHVFTRSSGVWTQQKKLIAPETSSHFGISVDIDGNTLVVGAQFEGAYPNGRGAVHIYTESGTSWTKQQRLETDDTLGDYIGGDQDGFGFRVDLDGDTLLVTDNLDDEATGGVSHSSGAVHLFTSSGWVWTRVAKLLGDTAIMQFGRRGVLWVVARAASGCTARLRNDPAARP